MMEMTPLRRTVLAMLLVAIPWFIVGVLSFAFLMQAHLEAGVTYSFGMRIAILAGGLMCLAALALCFDGARRKQGNPLLYLFALAAAWYLVEWPAKALMGIFHS